MHHMLFAFPHCYQLYSHLKREADLLLDHVRENARFHCGRFYHESPDRLGDRYHNRLMLDIVFTLSAHTDYLE